MRVSTIYAKDSTAAGLAAARDEYVRRRSLGQSSVIIIIPGLAAAHTTPPVTREALSQRPVPVVAPPTAQDRRIRSHHRSVGGYAMVFNVPVKISRNGHPFHCMFKPGAFRAAIAQGGWFLLRDHRTAADDGASSFASMARGTLHVEEDAYGLWFDAQLSDDYEGSYLLDRAKRGTLEGVSIGSYGNSTEGPVRADGLTVIHNMPHTWELSLVTYGKPACAQTWCLPNAEAQTRRHRERLLA